MSKASVYSVRLNLELETLAKISKVCEHFGITHTHFLRFAVNKADEFLRDLEKPNLTVEQQVIRSKLDM